MNLHLRLLFQLLEFANHPDYTAWEQCQAKKLTKSSSGHHPWCCRIGKDLRASCQSAIFAVLSGHVCQTRRNSAILRHVLAAVQPKLFLDQAEHGECYHATKEMCMYMLTGGNVNGTSSQGSLHLADGIAILSYNLSGHNTGFKLEGATLDGVSILLKNPCHSVFGVLRMLLLTR